MLGVAAEGGHRFGLPFEGVDEALERFRADRDAPDSLEDLVDRQVDPPTALLPRRTHAFQYTHPVRTGA